MSVLFQIEIDRSTTSFAFVSLNELDYYHDTDQHILFSLNSIFRIIHIERLEEKLWQMNLILIDDNDKQLKDLTNSIQKKSGKSKGFLSLGEMLFKMNDLHKAKNILQILLQNTNDLHQKDLFSIHRTLGRIYQKTNDFATAFFHYNECLKTQLSYLSPNDPSLSPTFASIGAISEKLGHLDQALEYFKRAADNNHHGSKIDPSFFAFYYNSLGRILLKQGENLEARKNFELALNFAQKSHVPNENFLAEIHRYLTIVS
jgi:tetratricopeptide (TPR) repeat protein